MARLTFEEYKHQIEVIKSMPSLAAMSDEISIFATSNEPKIVALIRLSDALLETYSVDESSSGETYDSLDAAYSEYTEDQVPQIIFDLINYEIDEYYEEEYKRTFDASKDKDSSFPFFNAFDTFSSDLPEAELTRIAILLIENEFISVVDNEDFVYAFSRKSIKDAKRISWLKTYNNKSNNIALAILLRHIAPEETSKYFKPVTAKMFKLFDLPAAQPTPDRSFESSLRLVREKEYSDTATTSLLNSILNPS